jgi:hypothetical protein
MTEDSLVCFFFDGEPGSAGMPDDTNHSDRVLEESFIGVTNDPDDPALQVAHAVHVINNGEIGDIIKEAVNGEIAAERILLGCSKAVHSDGIPVVGRDLFEFRMASKGGDLDDLSALKKDMNEPEPATDDSAVAEEGLDLAGVGVGGDIKILGDPSDEKVPDTSANQIGKEPMSMKTVKNLQGLFIDTLSRNGVLRPGNNDGGHNVPLTEELEMSVL